MINFRRLFRIALLFPVLLIANSCNRSDPAASHAASTSQPASRVPTVASLSPAATDLIIGMNAADHLVAISNYDPRRPETEKLPNAGDYLTTDWETLAAVHPAILIVQMEESRIPPGLREHASAVGATLVNIQIETVSDIFRTIDQLGAALTEIDKAAAASRTLHRQLDTVRQSVAGMPLKRTMICLNENGTSAAGAGTYLDELLTIGGGTNVLDGTSPHWPSIDRERIVALAPAAVLVLLPAATPQVVKVSHDFWSTVPGEVDGRVAIITDKWALTPGFEVGELAERFAVALHPAARLQPAARSAQ